MRQNKHFNAPCSHLCVVVCWQWELSVLAVEDEAKGTLPNERDYCSLDCNQVLCI